MLAADIWQEKQRMELEIAQTIQSFIDRTGFRVQTLAFEYLDVSSFWDDMPRYTVDRVQSQLIL